MKLTSSLNQFIVLAKIAETGGLSSAARELGMTPSAVSKSLSLLEEQLGVLLVRRTTRAVTLTTHGKMFFQRVSRILADVEDALDEVGDLRSQTKGDLHISCSIAFGCSQLVGIISRYKERYPDVNIHISLDDRLVNLGEENIDIALRITDATDGPYAARMLTQIRWVYCATPQYLEQHGRPQKPQDLKPQNHQLLVYPAMTNGGSWTYGHKRSLLQIKINASLECNSSLALLNFTLAHQGIACLPTYVADKHIKNGEIEVLFPDYQAASLHTLYAMYFQSRYKNPLIRTFVDFIRDDLKDCDWGRL
jgi:DNA-binding transcriptional LysR family regulator